MRFFFQKLHFLFTTTPRPLHLTRTVSPFLKYFLCVDLILTIALAAAAQAPVQDETDPMIAWYENFFQERKHGPVEKELEDTQNKLLEARQTNDPVAEVRALKEIGFIHLTRTKNYDQAMEYFVESLTLEDSLTLNEQQIFSYLGIARVFQEVGDNYKSSQALNQALAINQTLKNMQVYALILNEQGKVHAREGKLQEAEINYREVLQYKDQINQPTIEAQALSNLGHLQQMQSKYKEAMDLYRQALELRRAIRDKKNEAVSLNDIGELYRLMKNNTKAFANHTVALEIRKGVKDQRGIAESNNYLAELYYIQKDYTKALTHLGNALEAGRDAQAQHQLLKSFDYLSLCYQALGDYQRALEYKNQFSDISEFIQNERTEQQLLETQNRYDIEKNEARINKLENDRAKREKELAEQKKFRNFLFLIIGLGIVIVFLVLYLYVQKQRSNKVLQAANKTVHDQNVELQELNATKDKFFSIISHDLKGPLNSLTSFSGLLINHTDSLSKEDIQMLAKDLDKSVKNLFALLENLLEWSRSQTGNIEFKPESFDLGAVLEENRALLQNQAQNKKITLENTNKASIPIRAHKHSVNTVIRNLVSNAIKFTPEGGSVTLRAQVAHNQVRVSVTDTGVGMGPEIVSRLFRIDTKHSTKGTADEKGTGLGLILCKEFIEKNGGRIGVESEVDKGSVFHFTLPLPT